MAGLQRNRPPDQRREQADTTGDATFSVAEREDRLTWILGSSRSGSTWLLRMLAELDPVVPLDDPHLGHHLGVWRPIALAWSNTETLPDLTTLLELKRDKPDYLFSDRYREVWLPALRQFVAARFDAQARERAAERSIADPLVMVKEPGSHAADLIMSMFPGSGLIFLLRDGRDVVDSWLDAYKPGSWALEGGAHPVQPQDRLAFIRWQASVWLFRTELVQRVYDSHPESRRLLIRYEELRQDPVGALSRICERFGILARRDRLREVADRHAFVRAPGESKGPRRAMRFAEPGRWRLNMSEVEERAMLEIMGDKLTELGYLAPVPVGAISEGPSAR
jgi:Sulfotransferase family